MIISFLLNRSKLLLVRSFLFLSFPLGLFSQEPATDVQLEIAFAPPNVILSWVSEAGVSYDLQHSVDMGEDSFTRRNLAAGIEATSNQTSFTTPFSDDMGFYRVVMGQAIPTLPETPYIYANIDLPDHYETNGFPSQNSFQDAAVDHDNTPADNPITDAGATLGRVLFYDKELSANGTISCATCHVQSKGFSDSDTTSIGFEGGHTQRQSMGLTNARFNRAGKFFWDERAATLEEQVLQPFQDPVEMGLTLEELTSFVESQPYYPDLFTEAFGDEEVSTDRMAKALAQFVRSMVSTTSRYDEGRVQVSTPVQDFPNFTDQENDGKRLFMITGTRTVNCASCHTTEAFINAAAPNSTVSSALNIGLDAGSIDDDLGVRGTTGFVRDTDRFKVPSLRNIGVGAPYMHDGRFATLEEVVQHYSSGIQDHPQLENRLRDPETGEPVRLNFSESEQAALVAFLNTLTDEPFLTDPKFSDPFE